MECSARWSFIERDGARSSWSRIKALVISSGADFPELTMPVMSIRLEEKDLERIKSLASSDNKDQSTVARELISYAWNYLMVRRYAEGKLSLEGLARELGKTVSETIDLLAEMGVP